MDHHRGTRSLMTGRTHDMVGISIGSGTAVAFNLPTWAGLVLTATTCIASRLPDRAEGEWFKHRGPTHRAWTPILFGGITFAAGVWALHWSRTHALRTEKALQTHRLDAAVNWLYAAGLHALPLVAGGIALGALLHLIADACTVSGVPWRQTRVHLLPKKLRFTTGGWAERLLQVMILGFWVWIAFGEVRGALV